MVLAHGTAPSSFIVGLDAVEDSSNIPLRNIESTVAVVHYLSKTNRESQMKRQKMFPHRTHKTLKQSGEENSICRATAQNNERISFKCWNHSSHCGWDTLKEWIWKNKSSELLKQTPRTRYLSELDQKSVNFSALKSQGCLNKKSSNQARPIGQHQSCWPKRWKEWYLYLRILCRLEKTHSSNPTRFVLHS